MLRKSTDLLSKRVKKTAQGGFPYAVILNETCSFITYCKSLVLYAYSCDHFLVCPFVSTGHHLVSF